MMIPPHFHPEARYIVALNGGSATWSSAPACW